MSDLIDRDKLIADLESFNRPLCDDYHMKDYVFDQIITDIRNQPTVEAIPLNEKMCKLSRSDYILYSRKWLYEHLEQEFNILAEVSGKAEPVRHGHWIITGGTNVFGGTEIVCSECHDRVMVQRVEDELYCRHCGAKMDEVKHG